MNRKSKSVHWADRSNNFKALPEYRNKSKVNDEINVSNNANIHTETPKKNYQSPLLDNIHKMLCRSPGGVFKKSVPDFFRKMYKTKLPDNWYDLVKSSSLFEVEDTIGSNTIIYACNVPTDKEVSQETLNSEAVSMPELIYQWDKKFWNLSVTHCVSTIELYARIIGENYSEKFVSMMNAIQRLMMVNRKLALTITVGEIYLIYRSDCWHRVRVIKKRKDTFLCVFIDFGDEECVSIMEIFVCEAEFLKLAPQAIKFSLNGLKDFADNQKVTLDLYLKLIGKSFVGEIITTQKDFEKNINLSLTKYSPIDIILYDTSTPKNINVNDLLLKEINKRILAKPNQSSSYLVSEATSAINDLKMGSLVEQNPLSPNAFSEIKPIEKLLDSKKYLPVIVTMSTSPSNFVARPYENVSSFADFMNQLQIMFEKNLILPPEIIKVGETYAALSDDKKYCRVTVEEVLYSAKVRVFFCDFGDVKDLNKKELRNLPEIFRNVPKQAIRCRLSDVKPMYDKWSVHDCLNFQNLTKNKKFYALVENITFDESLRNNQVLEVDLLNVSIRNVLIQEGSAVRNCYSNY